MKRCQGVGGGTSSIPAVQDGHPLHEPGRRFSICLAMTIDDDSIHTTQVLPTLLLLYDAKANASSIVVS